MIDRNLGVLLIPPHDHVSAAGEPQATRRSHIPPEQPIPHPNGSRGEAPAESIDKSGSKTDPRDAPSRAPQGERPPRANGPVR